MKLKKTKEQANDGNTDKQIAYASSLFLTDGHIMRRKQEIIRRFGVLQSRKIYLERELKAVKLCMLSLDKQLQNCSKP